MISSPMSDVRCPMSCGSSFFAADVDVLVDDDVGTQDIGHRTSDIGHFHP
jgi:hypothetical protein